MPTWRIAWQQCFVGLLLLVAQIALASSPVYSVTIEGMTCGGCVESAKKELKALSNVNTESVHVVLSKKQATLSLKEAGQEDIKKISDAIKRAGFTVKSVIKN